jgi:hypothetical protein
MNIPLTRYIEAIQAENLTPGIDPSAIEIEGGYVSDLLSDVMGNVLEKQVWITIMRHLNVIAVASLSGVRAVVFPKGLHPDAAVIAKGAEENVLLLTTPLSTFETVGVLYHLLHA